MLDKQDNVHFYGPDHSWDGYKNYKGEIPFDGISILNEIHNCGVVLALSSDYHYRAGAATNRIYEACAAGAITISDTNNFIMKNFGDAVLYVDFDKKHPDNMFSQIMSHMDWIKRYPEKAFEKAKKAQHVFMEKFTLENQLNAIIANHENRKKAVSQSMNASDKTSKVLAVLFLDTDKYEKNEQKILENAIQNIKKQIDIDVTLVVCCDKQIEKEIIKYVEDGIRCEVFNFFDDFQNKNLSRGEVFRQVISIFPHEYLILLDGTELMFSNHITTLVRTLEDNDYAVVAYSGEFWDNVDGVRSIKLEHPINKEDFYERIYSNNHQYTSGAFLFKSDVETFLPIESDRYIDKYLTKTLLNLIVFKYQLSVKYSNILTVCKEQNINIDFPDILTPSQEKRFIQGLVQTDYEEWLTSYCRFEKIFMHNAEWHLYRFMMKYFKLVLLIEILFIHIGLLITFKKNERRKMKKKKKNLWREFNFKRDRYENIFPY